MVPLASAHALHEPLSTQIDTYLQRVVREQGFAGSVLVHKDGKTILRKGYGLADDARHMSITPETVFDVGSISKQFTAAAILQLEQQGKLRVMNCISTYLEHVPADKAAITLHQLLTHSSGLPDDYAGGDLEPLSREEALQAIFSLPLQSRPGEKYVYSNAGYTLLAAVIERVSGTSYPKYMKDHLFRPAGLLHTGFYNDPQWQRLSVAHGYWNGTDEGSPATWPGPYWTVMGNGGVMSTVDDLATWWQVLQAHTLLSPSQTEKLFHKYIKQDSEGEYYGYGWTIQQTEQGELITHNGGGIGGNSDIAFYQQEHVSIFICSNRITYRILFSLPYDIHLLATDTSKQLADNIFHHNFSRLPQPTFTLIPASLIAGGILLVFLLVMFRLRRKRKLAGQHTISKFSLRSPSKKPPA
ncbi:hypothetical protein KDA_47540 [Dictyobacter alpinus]|uniref:Beta-lactamase-related domain-containing protein n=2 Tax=Dictyobacter alpinus TaxID=2014873 RepID=A0A402BD76_9CHLR|nr:hypothetical protein KDA_47540 [Dictyobacter alpinus]